ncbi:hypothetical protein VTO42DRAFT_6402 [Malbranchea cinnamomea]
MSSPTLASGIAKSLPKGVELKVRHLTHPPTSCDPIFSPPPDEQPELTHFQSHFLVVSLRYSKNNEGKADNDCELLVFAIEVLVYTTAQLTTIFVSKADSAGYLYLLDLPPKSSSLIRNISTAFLSYLIRAHQRPGVRLVLCLFARAHGWYLFRGSAQNPHKHVLDDRGLIKWWCRAVDPILRSFEPEDQRQSKDFNKTTQEDGEKEPKKLEEKTNTSATAYLIVPGCEKPEMKTFFPPTFKSDDNCLRPRWVNGYPLHQLSSFPTAPPRCLVPRFPDDPKTRFLIDLDDSIPQGSSTGQWPSIKTLDQFWEMMAFRQECSAGRLVGFLWMVVNPPGVLNSDGIGPDKSAAKSAPSSSSAKAPPPASDKSLSTTLEQPGEKQGTPDPSTNPRPLTTIVTQSLPPRGVDPNTILLSHEDYTSATDFLTDHEFPDKETSLTSTGSWLEKLTSILHGDSNHGEKIIGECEPAPQPLSQSSTCADTTMNVLTTGFIRKRKKRDEPQAEEATNGVSTSDTTSSICARDRPAEVKERDALSTSANVLDAASIRKKRR